jgi:hypothetical protein
MEGHIYRKFGQWSLVLEESSPEHLCWLNGASRMEWYWIPKIECLNGMYDKPATSISGWARLRVQNGMVFNTTTNSNFGPGNITRTPEGNWSFNGWELDVVKSHGRRRLIWTAANESVNSVTWTRQESYGEVLSLKFFDGAWHKPPTQYDGEQTFIIKDGVVTKKGVKRSYVAEITQEMGDFFFCGWKLYKPNSSTKGAIWEKTDEVSLQKMPETLEWTRL